jgi:murein DD-endopeptidase MepM/ murein hydrolase activator NlpD
VSIDLSRVTAAEPEAAAKAPDAAAAQRQRDQLQRIAQEFESMLLRQVLRDMRRAGAWEEEPKGFGAETMGDVIEAELATHLTRNKGLGLSEQMLEQLKRMTEGIVAPATVAPSLEMMLPPASLMAVPDHAADSARTHAAPEVTSAFGWRTDPFNGRKTFHRGVDLAAAYGQDVQSARAGRVAFSGDQRGYGTTVVVEHEDGTKSRYAHLSQTLVTPGTMVAAGQTLGRAGNSGRATGTHLHFEVTSADGQPLSPSEWSNGRIG